MRCCCGDRTGAQLVWRGVLPALLGSLTGSIAIAITLSVGSFALAHAIQGLRSVLAIATIFALLVVVGHAVMRIVAGPAQADLFARRISGEGKNSAAGNLP